MVGDEEACKRSTWICQIWSTRLFSINMDPYTPRTRPGTRKKNLTLSAKEYTKVWIKLALGFHRANVVLLHRSLGQSRLSAETDN